MVKMKIYRSTSYLLVKLKEHEIINVWVCMLITGGNKAIIIPMWF